MTATETTTAAFEIASLARAATALLAPVEPCQAIVDALAVLGVIEARAEAFVE